MATISCLAAEFVIWMDKGDQSAHLLGKSPSSSSVAVDANFAARFCQIVCWEWERECIRSALNRFIIPIMNPLWCPYFTLITSFCWAQYKLRLVYYNSRVPPSAKFRLFLVKYSTTHLHPAMSISICWAECHGKLWLSDPTRLRVGVTGIHIIMLSTWVLLDWDVVCTNILVACLQNDGLAGWREMLILNMH